MKNEVKLGISLAVSAVALSPLLIKRVLDSRKDKKYQTFKLKNSQGAEVHIVPVGAAISRIIVPDKEGKKADVVLGYDSASDYEENENYFGVVVGRVANRIAGARFKLPNGQICELEANEGGKNALHGGSCGFQKRVFSGRLIEGADCKSVELKYSSAAGEQGYPGLLHVTVTYTLPNNKNEVQCRIDAVPEGETTPVNIVQHSSFNLAGHDSKCSILDHELRLPSADHYTPVTPSDLLPTGQIEPVRNTALDFTSPHAIGDRIVQLPSGYDHNYVLFNMGPQARFICRKGMATDRPKLAATLRDPKNGRQLDMYATTPGLQFYAGNFMDESAVGKGGTRYFKHAGLSLEPQAFPNSVNESMFPSIFINPGEKYHQEVVYKFSAT